MAAQLGARIVEAGNLGGVTAEQIAGQLVHRVIALFFQGSLYFLNGLGHIQLFWLALEHHGFLRYIRHQ